ncbi:DUF883 family protein [Thioalkalivibrio sp. ARh3]|uniref:DUF883 family protein n=1 Tax=Thioalkalivibrio sp. ARh3 TaxID=1158148 RepID=UPI0003804C25|nr:DUF883 family protein [Thioalkalivibrio sp. ARh3]
MATKDTQTKGEAENAASTTERVAAQAHEAVDRAAEHAAPAEEHIRERLSHADEEVRERAEKARQSSEDVLRVVGNYVRDNPLTAIGLAFVAGTLFSALTRRK